MLLYRDYTGHYVAFKILAAFRDQFYFSMLPLAPAKTAKLQSGEAVSRVMTDCERIEPFYAHTIAPAVTAILVPLIILAWCYTIEPSFVYVLAPFYFGSTFVLPWLVARLGGDGVDYRRQLGEVNAFVADSIQGVRDTVAFGYEKQRARKLFDIGASMQKGQEKLYGADSTNQTKAAFANNCILARRLVERGVRFVQLFNGAYASMGDLNWDGHGKLKEQYDVHGEILDQPVAGLLKDLKQRGLLHDTLVVCD